MSSVSVIIPAYNAAAYLGAALDSLRAQTRPVDQILVIDDGSKDDTAAIAEAFGHEADGRNVTCIRQPNGGEGAARNTGLRHATGDYIALVDADDLIAPTRIERQMAKLDARPDAAACLSGHWIFDDQGVRARYAGLAEAERASAISFLARLHSHPITMMFRREAARDLWFPLRVPTGADMIFLSALRTRGPFVVDEECLYGYRRHPQQITACQSAFDSLRNRLAWLEAQDVPTLFGVSRDTAVRELWTAQVEALQMHWWARRESEFLALQRDLRANWPPDMARPALLDQRWYPDWLWKMREAASAVKNAMSARGR